MNQIHHFFATTPKGLELLLADELKQLGATFAAEKLAGVVFQGTLEMAYRACLWSRLANRILLPLCEFPAEGPQELYEGIQTIDWRTHFTPEDTIAVDFNTVQSQITHTQFGAQKVKDAIVDQFRDYFGIRPSVKLDQPDIRINVYLYRDKATVSLDLSGESLHKRGYREASGIAPLKENLAAAILIRAGWPEIAKKGGALVDPMCGSGTLLIEAALIAGNIAPSLNRHYFGFIKWRQHKPEIWSNLITEAKEKKIIGLGQIPIIIGYDADTRAIKLANQTIHNADLLKFIHVEKRELIQCTIPENTPVGLFIANPPYGERIGEEAELQYLYNYLGKVLKERFIDWKASILTANPNLGKKMGVRAQKIYALYNGAIPCKLLNFTIVPDYFVNENPHMAIENSLANNAQELSSGAEMLLNRLQKNFKNYQKWIKREDITCYRLYDADLPEYAAAIDIYEQWVHVQEYEAPKTIDPEKAAKRLNEILQVVPIVTSIPAENIFLKVRRQQKGKSQYEKLASMGKFYEIKENNASFLVNFTDYLDTGIFLDHRITRQLIHDMSKGKRFLNLFAYTGTATVYAALGGAKVTTTVDMSSVYLNWAKRNLSLNGFSTGKHIFIQADCLQWLMEDKYQYDLIFLDPPTFSNSKRMHATFDIQRDHIELLSLVSKRLDKEGTLLFSNNKRGFKLDMEKLEKIFNITDITYKTIPLDFRKTKIHQCWLMTKV
ncbi:MAG: Ribosomal RNA large subunit methyltransferase K/L [Legionellaceae bacterium]